MTHRSRQLAPPAACGDSSLALDLGPSPLLCFLHALSSRCGEFSAFERGRFRRGSWFRPASVQHGPEFGNLRVDVPLLFLEAENGGIDDLRGEVASGHLKSI